MLIEIAVAVVIVLLFSEYLKWANTYYGAAEFNDEKKNAFAYSLLPPKALAESHKVVQFWTNYYYETVF